MRKILLIILLTFTLLLTSCKDYLYYKDVEIPDENLGSVKIPNNWEFRIVDEWIHIIDIENDETIGIQWYKGIYYRIGQEIRDEREFNPYFEEYIILSSSFSSGNSNGSQWGTVSFKEENITYAYRLIYFIGSLESSYLSEIVIISELIEDSVLSNVAKSYKR